MRPIFALQAIAEMRPKTFVKDAVYLVRIAPYCKTQTLRLPHNLISLEKKRGWVKVVGEKAVILDSYVETGYKKREAYYRNPSRILRPLCDIAHNPDEAREIERLYEIDARQAMPGTADRPHAGTGLPGIVEQSDEAKKTLERLRLMAAAPVAADGAAQFVDDHGQWAVPPSAKTQDSATGPRVIEGDEGEFATPVATLDNYDEPVETSPAPYTLSELAVKMGIADAGSTTPSAPESPAVPSRPKRPSSKTSI